MLSNFFMYGEDKVKLATYPDNFTEELELGSLLQHVGLGAGDAHVGGGIGSGLQDELHAELLAGLLQTIVNMSDDPLMKAIIVNQSVPGTAEAFSMTATRRLMVS